MINSQFYSIGKRLTQEEDSFSLESNNVLKHHGKPKHHAPVPRPFSVSEDGHRFIFSDLCTFKIIACEPVGSVVQDILIK